MLIYIYLGTFVYMAPEVIKSGPYDEKCDVYSFGILLNELITGKYPYIDTDFGPSKVCCNFDFNLFILIIFFKINFVIKWKYQIAKEVAENGLRPEIAEVGEELEGVVELISKSWAQDPDIRPIFAEITSVLRILDKKMREN